MTDKWLHEKFSVVSILKGRPMSKKKRYVYRSSVTGEFVSRWYAICHPKTTTKERVS